MKAGRAERNNIVYKIASHFKIAKKKLLDTIDTSLDIISLDDNPFFTSRRFVDQIYALSVASFTFSEIVFYHKFIKSKLFEAFLNAEGLTEHHLVMTFTVSDLTMCLYRANAYEGFGGIFLRANNVEPDEGAFVIEPFKNFLNHRYPILDVD